MEEMRELNFSALRIDPGGVTCRGDWRAVWRANLSLRIASRVLVRVGDFPARHLAQLEQRAGRLPWRQLLRRDAPFRVEATCKRSKIYHSGAAAGRVAAAIERAGCAAGEGDDEVLIHTRIEQDQVTLSLDTSGELLHRRGFKQAVNKAPMRENLAAAFLRASGADGSIPVMDPMCGSGTFVIEAAERALGLLPGRGRSFAFERLGTFAAEEYATLRQKLLVPALSTPFAFDGRDRDGSAVEMAIANAARAGVDAACNFSSAPVSAATPPDGPTGLLICNPPYGARLNDAASLKSLYQRFGRIAQDRFAGWTVAMVTANPDLARATGLTWAETGPPVPHGGLRVRLYKTSVKRTPEEKVASEKAL